MSCSHHSGVCTNYHLQHFYAPILRFFVCLVLLVLLLQRQDEAGLRGNGLLHEGSPADCDSRSDGASQRYDVDEIDRLHKPPLSNDTTDNDDVTSVRIGVGVA